MAEELGVGEASENDLYQAMDWLLERQPRIEKKLAARHLHEGSLVLYDVSSSYYEGPLAQYGHDRDGKTGLPIIVYGVMTDRQGRPVAVEVYAGNTGDATTVADQVNKLRERFQLSRLVLVGDRGMLTQRQINQLKAHPQRGWITPLTGVAVAACWQRAPCNRRCWTSGIWWRSNPGRSRGALDGATNPWQAKQRRRKPEELLAATEKELTRIAKAAERRTHKPLQSTEIALQVGKVLGRYKMGKHFQHTIGEGKLSWSRGTEAIADEARVDGIYVIRTSEAAEQLSAADTVRSYKSLAQVERAFCSLKDLDLLIRHIFSYASWLTTRSGIWDR